MLYDTTIRFTRAEDGSGREFRLQEPGEEGGQFYSLWKTPLSQLGDFGVGVGCVRFSGGENPNAPLTRELPSFRVSMRGESHMLAWSMVLRVPFDDVHVFFAIGKIEITSNNVITHHHCGHHRQKVTIAKKQQHRSSFRVLLPVLLPCFVAWRCVALRCVAACTFRPSLCSEWCFFWPVWPTSTPSPTSDPSTTQTGRA